MPPGKAFAVAGRKQRKQLGIVVPCAGERRPGGSARDREPWRASGEARGEQSGLGAIRATGVEVVVRPGGQAPGDERHHAAGREGEHRLVRRDVPHRIGGGRDRAERRFPLGLDHEAHPAERHLGNPARRHVA